MVPTVSVFLKIILTRNVTMRGRRYCSSNNSQCMKVCEVTSQQGRRKQKESGPKKDRNRRVTHVGQEWLNMAGKRQSTTCSTWQSFVKHIGISEDFRTRDKTLFWKYLLKCNDTVNNKKNLKSVQRYRKISVKPMLTTESPDSYDMSMLSGPLPHWLILYFS